MGAWEERVVVDKVVLARARQDLEVRRRLTSRTGKAEKGAVIQAIAIPVEVEAEVAGEVEAEVAMEMMKDGLIRAEEAVVLRFNLQCHPIFPRPASNPIHAARAACG